MKISSKQRLSINLGKIREEQDLSLEAVALNCQVSVRHFGDIERGQCNTTLDTLDKISNGISVSASELLADNQYQTLSSKVIINDKVVVTYGIKNGDNVIFDISTDLKFVNYITKLLNDNKVSLVHFRDIVEDFVPGHSQ